MTTSKKTVSLLVLALLLATLLLLMAMGNLSGRAALATDETAYRVFANGWSFTYDANNEWQEFEVPISGYYMLSCYGGLGGYALEEPEETNYAMTLNPETGELERIPWDDSYTGVYYKTRSGSRYYCAVWNKYRGGYGGYVSAKCFLQAGTKLYLSPGKNSTQYGYGREWNEYADATAGGGGGGSRIAYEGTTVDDVILVAGGGGGANPTGQTGSDGGGAGNIYANRYDHGWATCDDPYVQFSEELVATGATGFAGGESTRKTYQPFRYCIAKEAYDNWDATLYKDWRASLDASYNPAKDPILHLPMTTYRRVRDPENDVYNGDGFLLKSAYKLDFCGPGAEYYETVYSVVKQAFGAAESGTAEYTYYDNLLESLPAVEDYTYGSCRYDGSNYDGDAYYNTILKKGGSSGGASFAYGYEQTLRKNGVDYVFKYFADFPGSEAVSGDIKFDDTHAEPGASTSGKITIAIVADLSFTDEWTFTDAGYTKGMIIPYDGEYTITCYGAHGGEAILNDGETTIDGGLGGYVTARGHFQTGDILYVYVGKEGESFVTETPDGVNGEGGEASYVQLNSLSRSSTIILAGGGGGAGVLHSGQGGGGTTRTIGTNAPLTGYDGGSGAYEYDPLTDTHTGDGQAAPLYSGGRGGDGGSSYVVGLTKRYFDEDTQTYGTETYFDPSFDTSGYSFMTDAEGSTIAEAIGSHEYAADRFDGIVIISYVGADDSVDFSPHLMQGTKTSQGEQAYGDVRILKPIEPGWVDVTAVAGATATADGYETNGKIYVDAGQFLTVGAFSTSLDANANLCVSVALHNAISLSTVLLYDSCDQVLYELMYDGFTGFAREIMHVGNTLEDCYISGVTECGVRQPDSNTYVYGGVITSGANHTTTPHVEYAYVNDDPMLNRLAVTDGNVRKQYLSGTSEFLVTVSGLYSLQAWMIPDERAENVPETIYAYEGKIWLNAGETVAVQEETEDQTVTINSYDELGNIVYSYTTTITIVTQTSLTLRGVEGAQVFTMAGPVIPDPEEEVPEVYLYLQEYGVCRAMTSKKSVTAAYLYLVDVDPTRPTIERSELDREGVVVNGLPYYYDSVSVSLHCRDRENGVVTIGYSLTDALTPTAIVPIETVEINGNDYDAYTTIVFSPDPMGADIQDYTVRLFAYDYVGNVALVETLFFAFDIRVNRVEYYTGMDVGFRPVEYNIETPVFSMPDLRREYFDLSFLTDSSFYALAKEVDPDGIFAYVYEREPRVAYEYLSALGLDLFDWEEVDWSAANVIGAIDFTRTNLLRDYDWAASAFDFEDVNWNAYFLAVVLENLAPGAGYETFAEWIAGESMTATDLGYLFRSVWDVVPAVAEEYVGYRYSVSDGDVASYAANGWTTYDFSDFDFDNFPWGKAFGACLEIGDRRTEEERERDRFFAILYEAEPETLVRYLATHDKRNLFRFLVDAETATGLDLIEPEDLPYGSAQFDWASYDLDAIVLYANFDYDVLDWSEFDKEIDPSTYDWANSVKTQAEAEREVSFRVWNAFSDVAFLEYLADVTGHTGYYAEMKKTILLQLERDMPEVLFDDAEIWTTLMTAFRSEEYVAADTDWEEMDVSEVDLTAYFADADAGAFWDATDLPSFDFLGWYEINDGELLQDIRFVSIDPANQASRHDYDFYPLMTLNPIVFTNDTGSSVTRTYNVGTVGISTPAFTKPNPAATVTYDWTRTKDETTLGLAYHTADLTLAYGADADISTIGTYVYKVTVTAHLTLSFKGISNAYASDGVVAEDIVVVVTAKALTHEDIIIIGGTATKTFNGTEQEQDVTVMDGETVLSILGSDASYTLTYNNNVNANSAIPDVADRSSVTIAAKAGSNYSGSVTLYFTINPRSIAAFSVAEVAAETYDGEEHTPEPAVTWTSAGTPITLVKDADCTYAYANNLNAGQAAIIIVGINNYTGVIDTTRFTITKATATIDVSAIEAATYTYRYDETYAPVEQRVEDAAVATIASGQVLTYTNSTFSTVPASGTLTVTINAIESANYFPTSRDVTVTIGKADSFVDVTDVDRDYAYDPGQDGLGVEQFLTGTATTTPEQTAGIAFLWKDTTDAFSFTDVPLTSDEVGYYYEVYAAVPASDNFLAAASATFRVYVAKAEYDVTVEEAGSRDFTYDGEDHVVEEFLTVAVSQGATVTYGNSTLHYRPQSGVCTVTATVGETRNFAEKTVPFDVTITAASASLNVNAITLEYVYDGSDIVVEGATATYRKPGDTAIAGITYENNVFRYVADSGDMTVRFVNADGYYCYVEEEVVLSVIIRKATHVLSGDVIPLTAVYGQTVANVAGMYERPDGTYTIDQAPETSVGTVASPAALTLTFTPNDTANYNVVAGIRVYTPADAEYSAAKVTFTVLRATRVLDVSGVERAYEYRIYRQNFTGATRLDGEGTIVYTPAYFTEVADMDAYKLVPGDADDHRYTLTISVAETANYLAAEEALTITVVKATSEVSVAGILSFTYDGNPHSVSSGAVIYNNEQTLTYSENSFTTVAEAEATTVTIGAEETANYYATSVSYTPVMDRAITSIRFLGQVTGYVYTGEIQTVVGEVELNNDEQTESIRFENNTFRTVPEGNNLVVRITIDQSANYLAGELEFRIHVDKAIPETRAQAVEVYYGRKLVNATGLETNYTFIDGNIGVGTVAEPVTGLYCKYTPPLGEEVNYYAVDTVPLTVTVLKADPALSVGAVRKEYVYTGETFTVDSGATINNTEQTIVYDPTTNTFTNVAEGQGRQVRIYVETSDNYQASERLVTITMRKATSILDVSGMATTYTYNGRVQTVDGAVLTYGDGVIRYSANTFTTVAEGRAIGAVTVSVDATENFTAVSARVEITVNKARQTVTYAVPDLTYVYTGDIQYVFASIADNEQRLIAENNAFTTVAEGNGREVRFSASETPNYEAIYEAVRITVEKRTPETSAQEVEAYYGQILYELSSALPQGYTFEQNPNLRVGTPDDPRAVSLTYTPDDVDNVAIVENVACTLLVRKKPITVTLTSIETTYGDDGYDTRELTYDELPEGTLVGSDAIEVAPEREAGSLPGEYAITATVESDLYDVTVEAGVYTIRRRPIVLDFPVKESFYGEEVIRPVYEIYSGNLVFGEELTGELVFASEPTIAADYIVECHVTNDRYDVTLRSAVYTVKRRPIIVYANVIESVYGVEPAYNYSVEKKDDSLTGEAMPEGDALNGSLYLDNYNVGKRNILSRLFNSNYEITYVGAYCTVTPAPITVTADALETVYGEGASFTYTVTEGAVLEGDDLRASLTQADPNVGEHDIDGAFYNGNYNVTFVTAKHTVVPREVTIKLGDQSKTRLEFIRDGSLSADEYTVIRGSVVTGDDLLLTVRKADGTSIGEYDLTATSGNANYDVTVIKGKFHLVKDDCYITVDPSSLTVVEDGRAHWVSATVSSGAKPEFYYKGATSATARIAPGKYLIRITAPSTNEYNEPEPVEVTLTILQAEMTDETTGVTVMANSSGFNAGDKLVIDDTLTEWDENDGELPEQYAVTASYVIKKVDVSNNESALDGEVTVTIALPKRYANRGSVHLALVENGEVSIVEADVNDDGTVTVSGINLTKVAVVEKQSTPTLAIILIIAAAAVLLLFVFIMIRAGRAK